MDVSLDRRERIGCIATGCARCLAAVFLFLGLFGTAASAADESPQAVELQVKAAFLFKFSGYVEWPQSAFAELGSPLVIGVTGDDALAMELGRTVANRTMNGRSVSVRKFRGDEDFSGVHVLFVGRSQLERLGELVTHPRPVLAVTDVAKGLEQGSIINFVTVGNRVRFEVALDSARRSGLKIGAPLLSVAMRVQE